MAALRRFNWWWLFAAFAAIHTTIVFFTEGITSIAGTASLGVSLALLALARVEDIEKGKS